MSVRLLEVEVERTRGRSEWKKGERRSESATPTLLNRWIDGENVRVELTLLNTLQQQAELKREVEDCRRMKTKRLLSSKASSLSLHLLD
jgi:hypothetical protein